MQYMHYMQNMCVCVWGETAAFPLKKARHLTLIVEKSEFTAFWAPVYQEARAPLFY